jgi:hypothetical protein
MSVVDKVINEWAFRCKKGYPDMNNPDDIKILKEIYSEYGIIMEEEKPKEDTEKYTTEDLIKLLQSKQSELDSDFIQKIYHTIASKGQKLGSQILAILQQKGLGGSSNEIFSIIHQYTGLEQQLLEFFKDEKKQVTLAQFKAGTNIIDTVQQLTGLPKEFINTLITAGKSSEGGKGVGNGEALVALVGKEGKKLKVGDVEVEGKEIEVKGHGGRLIGRAEPLVDFYAKLSQLGVPARRGGKEAIHTYIPYILSQKPEAKDQIEKLFKEEFPSNTAIDLTSEESIYVAMISWYVDFFLNNEAKTADYVLIVVGQDYRLFTREEFKQAAIKGEVTFGSFTPTNKSPQINQLTK